MYILYIYHTSISLESRLKPGSAGKLETLRDVKICLEGDRPRGEISQETSIASETGFCFSKWLAGSHVFF